MTTIRGLTPKDGWLVGRSMQTKRPFFSDGSMLAIGDPPGGKVRTEMALQMNFQSILGRTLARCRVAGKAPDPVLPKRELVWFSDGLPFDAAYIEALEKHFRSTDWRRGAAAQCYPRVLFQDGKPVAIVMAVLVSEAAPRSIRLKFRKVVKL